MTTKLELWMRERGRMTFAQFMEEALYHPEWGYYTSDRRKFGKEGDFYTSPGVSPVFAEMLADDLAAKWKEMGADRFDLIEFGAGEGRLARDLLRRWQAEHPALYEQAAYRIVEISPTLRELQRVTLAEQGEKVSWLSAPELIAAGPYVGAVLTNELVDAFPVHRVTRQDGELQELYVEWEEGQARFVETAGPLSEERIQAYLAKYGSSRPGLGSEGAQKRPLNGQIVEVGLAGLDWYERALGLMERGYVVTIDYGFEADMLYHATRMKGTLRGFYRHTLTDDPFQHIGEQDLTADINFTALLKRGEELGWQTEFFGSQSKYLLQAGILQRLTDAVGADPFKDPDMKRNRAIRQLVMPGGMGDHFKVLVQRNLV